MDPDLAVVVAIRCTFWTLSTISILFKASSWLRAPKNPSSAFTRLEVRYFVCWYAMQIQLMLFSPCLLTRFLEGGITHEDIAQLRIVLNIISAIFSLFLGNALNRFGPVSCILTSTVASAISTVLRAIGGWHCFLYGQIAVALASPLLRVGFDSWYHREVSEIHDCPQSSEIFNENFHFLHVLIAIVVDPVSDALEARLGTRPVFLISAVLALLAVVPMLLLLPSGRDRDPADPRLNYMIVLKAVAGGADRSLKFVVIADMCYSVIPFIFTTNITSYFIEVPKLPNGVLLGAHSLAILVGAQIATLVGDRIPVVPRLVGGFGMATATAALMSIKFENKLVLHLLLESAGCWEGVITGTLLELRRRSYPAEIRGHIFGMIRLSTSVIASVALYVTKAIDKSRQLESCAVVLAMALAGAIGLYLTEMEKRIE
jgi:hypothetical protein